jgi:hypothetical protein
VSVAVVYAPAPLEFREKWKNMNFETSCRGSLSSEESAVREAIRRSFVAGGGGLP